THCYILTLLTSYLFFFSYSILLLPRSTLFPYTTLFRSEAKGRYIAFVDSDDKWYPEKLERQLDFMENYHKAFTYTNYEHITEEGEVLSSPKLPEKLNYSDLLKNTAIACSTVVIDRQIIGDFRMPLVRKGQDTATWLQILRNHDYAYLVDEILNQY